MAEGASMTLVRRSGVWVLTVGNVVYVGTLRGVLEGGRWKQ